MLFYDTNKNVWFGMWKILNRTKFHFNYARMLSLSHTLDRAQLFLNRKSKKVAEKELMLGKANG